MEKPQDHSTSLRIEREKKAKLKHLTSETLSGWLEVVGWIFFGIGILIGSATLTLGIEKNENVASSFGYLISGVVILLIFLGIAKVIEQNIFLIKKLQKIEIP